MASVKYELDMITKNIELATSVDDISLQLDMYNTTMRRMIDFLDSRRNDVGIKDKIRLNSLLMELITILNEKSPILKLPAEMYYYIRPFCKISTSPIAWTTMHNSSVGRYIDMSEQFYLLFEGYLTNNVDNNYYLTIIHNILDTIKERRFYQTDNEILLQYIKAQLKSIIYRLHNVERILIAPEKYIPGRYGDMSILSHMEKAGLDNVKDVPLDEINETVNNLIFKAYEYIRTKKSVDNIRQDIADEFEKYLSENVNIGGLGLRYGGYELYNSADDLIDILNRIKEVK